MMTMTETLKLEAERSLSILLYVTEMGKGQPSLQGQLRKNHCCTCSRIIYLCIGLWPFHHDRIISLDSVITRNIIDALIFEILSHLWHHKNS